MPAGSEGTGGGDGGMWGVVRARFLPGLTPASLLERCGCCSYGVGVGVGFALGRTRAVNFLRGRFNLLSRTSGGM